MTVGAHELVEVGPRGESVYVDTQGERVLSISSAYALASRLIDAAQQAGDNPLVPLLDRVVVHVIEESDRKSGGGVFIPDNAQPAAIRGIVLAIGPGRYVGGSASVKPAEKFEKIEGLEVGDVVTMSKHAGYEIKVGDMTYLSIRAGDILAMIPVRKRGESAP